MISRFIVSGILDGHLVENHTDDFDVALMLWDTMRSHGEYLSVRIWDTAHEVFVQDHILELALKYLSQ